MAVTPVYFNCLDSAPMGLDVRGLGAATAPFRKLCSALEKAICRQAECEREACDAKLQRVAAKYFPDTPRHVACSKLRCACACPPSAFPLEFILEDTWFGAISQEALIQRGCPSVVCATAALDKRRVVRGMHTTWQLA